MDRGVDSASGPAPPHAYPLPKDSRVDKHTIKGRAAVKRTIEHLRQLQAEEVLNRTGGLYTFYDLPWYLRSDPRKDTHDSKGTELRVLDGFGGAPYGLRNKHHACYECGQYCLELPLPPHQVGACPYFTKESRWEALRAKRPHPHGDDSDHSEGSSGRTRFSMKE